MSARPGTERVLRDVEAHRREQVARYGENHDLEYGTGPGVPWLTPVSSASAERVEKWLRLDYEAHGGDKKATWVRLLREELAEAVCETDPAKLRAELVQLAALAVSWIETIDHHEDEASVLPELECDRADYHDRHRWIRNYDEGSTAYRCPGR